MNSLLWPNHVKKVNEKNVLQNNERGQQKMAMSKEPGHLKLVLIH